GEQVHAALIVWRIFAKGVTAGRITRATQVAATRAARAAIAPAVRGSAAGEEASDERELGSVEGHCNRDGVDDGDGARDWARRRQPGGRRHEGRRQHWHGE